MMNGLKLSEVISRFTGEDGADIVTWVKKFQMVAQAKELGDIATLMPLFLDGSAYAVYEEMAPGDKKSVDKIEATLFKAFALDPFRAYEQLTTRTYVEGEPVDVYLADLRRLTKLASVESDAVLRCAFITGLPKSVSAQLRATVKITEAPLDIVVEMARALVSELKEPTVRVAAARKMGSRVKSVRTVNSEDRLNSRKGPPTPKCYGCGGPHLKRWCPQARCFKCDGVGHLARDCQAGNVQGESQ